jgi:hypothetical protein
LRKNKKKKEKNKKATQTVPTTTIAILPLVETATGPYYCSKRRQESNRRSKRRFEAISTNVESDYLFS